MRLGMGLRLSDLLKHGATPSTLLDGLVSYWLLDEQSGTRYDAVGDNDLTDNNTVGYAPGMNGNAASFVTANQEYLNASGPILDETKSFSASSWFRPTNVGVAHSLLNIDNVGTRPVNVDYEPGVGPRFYVNGAGAAYLTGTTFSANEWHHILVCFDSSDGTHGKAYLYVDGLSTASASLSAAMGDTSGIPLRIGGRQSFGDQYAQGQIDEVAIWSRVLTEDERAELYNAGSGFFYPFT